MTEKQIMVNLGDESIKEISEVIGNKSCNKIIDFLAERESTVTEISNSLKIPLNTVDYNIKKLTKVGLIEKADSFWSVKGKRMPSYRVSNKKIVISPKKFMGKQFLLAAGITGVLAISLRNFMKIGELLTNRVDNIAYSSMPVSDIALRETSMKISEGATQSIPIVSNEIIKTGLLNSMGAWSWFLIGAWFTIVLFLIFTTFERRAKH